MRVAAVLLCLAASAVRATITGQRQCSRAMCVTGLHDDTTNTDTYTIAGPASGEIAASNFGWAAIGFGSSMAGSPMLISWPNGDGSITLSQRTGAGNFEPDVTANPARTASLVSSSSFANSSATSMTFTLPSDSSQLTSGATFNLMWAYSGTNPSSSATDAGLRMHSSAGVFQFNLLAQWAAGGANETGETTGGTTGTTGSTGSSDSTTSSSASAGKNILVAHVVTGALATMLFLPLGILVPRYARGLTTKRWWFPTHSALNGLVAFALVIAAFVIGKTKFGDTGDTSPHSNLGLALLVLMCAQIVLGVIAHWIKIPIRALKTSSGRGPVHYLHVGLGLVTVVIGWVTVWYGMGNQWNANTGYAPVSSGYKAGWGVIVGVVIVLYIIGLVLFLPKQRALEAEQKEGQQGEFQSRQMSSTSGARAAYP